jgi:hypothetical protein
MAAEDDGESGGEESTHGAAVKKQDQFHGDRGHESLNFGHR